ncbi:MAG: hypothetical protein IH571_01655 [Acholeplasmataceae bacterium]|nr:hypothetical protein [Acholeplasmataceae bacterium]
MKSSKRYYFAVVAMIYVMFIVLGTVSYAWFVLINRTDSFIVTASKVDISYHAYLEGIYDQIDYFEFDSGTTTTKIGVYRINVSDIDADDYITNFRLNILVNSTIDSFIRVRIVDSLTLATIDFQGVRGEVAIVDQPIDYAFSRHWDVNGILYDDLADAEAALGGITSTDVVTKIDDWYDNRLEDGYMYYPQKIERTTSSPQMVLSLIEEYDGLTFKAKSVGYSLQFAIIVESIQASHDAPIINWKLDMPPWGGSWS